MTLTRVRWADDSSRVTERIPQRKGAGAWHRRDKHRRSGFSNGSGLDDSTKVAVKYQCISDREQCGAAAVTTATTVLVATVQRSVKYQCIGEQCGGGSSDNSDDSASGSSTEVGRAIRGDM